MRNTATPRQSPPSSWGVDIRSHQHIILSDTPTGFPSSSFFFTGPVPSPFLHPQHSDTAYAAPASSPNYFGILVDTSSNPPDSNPGLYTKRNWDFLAHSHSSIPSPTLAPDQALRQLYQPTHLIAQVADKRQVSGREMFDRNRSSSGVLHHDVGSSIFPHTMNYPTGPLMQGEREHETDIDQIDTSVPDDTMRGLSRRIGSQQIQSPPSSLGLPRTFSPGTYSSGSEGRIPSLSLPVHRTQPPGPISPYQQRVGTLPISLDNRNFSFVSTEKCAELLQTASEQVLLLDVRPYPQFSQANIYESLNLCIPTTLLKRPSFNTDKLKDTFVVESEKHKFAAWKQSTYIVVYDSATEHPRDTAPLINVLKKFGAEGWHGQALILRGGFTAFASRFPNRIRQQRQDVKAASSAKQPRSINLNLPSAKSIAGGCSMPDSSTADAFFGNIRQNMDLVGGVGQIPVKLPSDLTEAQRDLLPSWLRAASDSKDKGHTISERFLEIEKMELHRMREALTSNVSYDKPELNSPSKKFLVAGIEKGSKNRYNDIYPFDHSRVRLQDIPFAGCDYVNANHVKADYTNKSYIATQAPVPDTFTDFWRVVWEQDVRVIVALTAEVERGQIKCHPYWNPGDYGSFKLKVLTEKRVSMDATMVDDTHSQQGQHHSMPGSPIQGILVKASDEAPYILIRHFTLLHSAFPFQPIREITQLQYAHWPDFGTTSQPTHLLKLVELCNKLTRTSSSHPFGNEDAEPAGQRPVLVHCSAGCGRTGTFCTVDSVLDILKSQYANQLKPTVGHNVPSNPSSGDWAYDDNIDLVAKTVEDFRTQRPSMVQTLSQFVLCYESILEWAVAHLSDERKS